MALSNFPKVKASLAPLPRPRWIACTTARSSAAPVVADERGVALGFGQRRGVVAAAVGQRVGDLPGAVDRQRFQDHDVGVA